ncbi:23806_t:CDS:2, partial [Gigaspora rosea]
RRNQRNATANRQRRINNPQLLYVACNFSENTNMNNFSFPHQINITGTLNYRANVIPDSDLDANVIQALKTMLDEINPYVINFRYISNLPSVNLRNLSLIIHTNIPGFDQRTYNVPTAPQVAAIWLDDDISSNKIWKRDIILRTHMNQLVQISEIDGCYDPLAYPLLFPYGEQGWPPYSVPYKDVPYTSQNIENMNNRNYNSTFNNTIHHRKF